MNDEVLPHRSSFLPYRSSSMSSPPQKFLAPVLLLGAGAVLTLVSFYDRIMPVATVLLAFSLLAWHFALPRSEGKLRRLPAVLLTALLFFVLCIVLNARLAERVAPLVPATQPSSS